MAKQDTKELTDEQAKRYSRHILIPSMDWEGQERLLASRVLMIGVGGLGCAVAQYLAASGVGKITLVDNDNVELSNLQRQILHMEKDVGLNKAQSAKESLQLLNSDTDVVAITQRLDKSRLLELAQDVDVLIDCTDNLSSRNLLNEISIQMGIALITGAAIRMEGQVSCFVPFRAQEAHKAAASDAVKTPCYACLSYLFGEQQLSCMESGVLAPLVGIIGSMQALEVVKYLAEVGTTPNGKVLLFDAANSQWREMQIAVNPNCIVCSNS